MATIQDQVPIAIPILSYKVQATREDRTTQLQQEKPNISS